MRANLEDNLATRLRQKLTKWGTMTLAMTGDYVVSASGPTFHFLDPGASTRIVRLPVLEDGMLYFIKNTGTTNLLNVVDFGGTSIVTFATGKGGIVFANQFSWAAITDSTGPTGPQGPPGSAVLAATSTSTQTSSNSGTKTFTATPLGLGYSAGSRVRALDLANPTVNYMEGVVTLYSGVTGVLVFTADAAVGGGGPFSAWNINVAGDRGSQGPAGSGVTGGANHQIALYSAPGTVSVGLGIADANILVGKASADPISAAVSGDLTMDNTGAFTIGATKVTYTKFQDIAGLSVHGRAGSTSGVSGAITGTANQFIQVNSGGTSFGFVSLIGDGSLADGTLTIGSAKISYSKIQNLAGTLRYGEISEYEWCGGRYHRDDRPGFARKYCGERSGIWHDCDSGNY